MSERAGFRGLASPATPVRVPEPFGPEPLAKDHPGHPERLQDSYLTPAARAVWASIGLRGTHRSHLNLAASSP